MPKPERAGSREDGRPRQRQGCRAAARREVPGAEEQPCRRGDAREGHQSAEGAAGGGRRVGEVEARGCRAGRRQAEDRRDGGSEVGAGKKAPDVTPHDNPEVAPKDEHRPQFVAGAARSAPEEPRADARDGRPVAAARGRRRRRSATAAVRGRNSDPSRQADGDRSSWRCPTRTSNTCSAPRPRRSGAWRRHSGRPGQGKFQQSAARVRSSLENFIPEVKPGNQTALNTRAAPFAAYIAQDAPEHPQAVGLRRARGLGRDCRDPAPSTTRSLSTTLEMVLNRDGTVDKVDDRARLGLPGVRRRGRSTSRSTPARTRIRRARSGRQTARSTSTGSSIATSASARRRASITSSSTTRPPGADDGRPGTPPEAPRAVGAPATGGAAPAAGGTAPATGGAVAPSTHARRARTDNDGGLRRLRRFDDRRPRREDAAPRRGGGDGRGADRGVVARRIRRDAAARAPRRRRARRDPAARGGRANAGSRRSRRATPRRFRRWRRCRSRRRGKDVTKQAALAAMLTDLVGEEKASKAPRRGDLHDRRAARRHRQAARQRRRRQRRCSSTRWPRTDRATRSILILAQRGAVWRPVGLVRR